MLNTFSQYLRELLFIHDSFALPGLGSFVCSPAPALVDQVQGQVSAPAKQISFNEQLVLDDGLLHAFVAKQQAYSLEEAQAWVGNQIAEIKAALDRKEIVELPGVGRFFRNFEQQLQFVAEHENFNTNAFGLMPVRATLVSRTSAEKEMAAAAATGAKTKMPPITENTVLAPTAGFNWQKNLWWILLIGVLLIGVLLFQFIGPYATPTPPTDATELADDLPEERLNMSPSKDVEDSTATTIIDEPEIAPEEETPTIDTEAPTLAPNEHSAVIAVGLFGNVDNVERLIQTLSEQGFAPTTFKEGKLTRVGVTVRYERESELQRELRELRKLHTESAFVLFKDGKRLK